VPEQDGDRHGVVRLSLTEPTDLPAARVLALFDDPSWFGTEVAPAPAGLRRYAADLRLRVSDRLPRATFAKAALVDPGRPRRLLRSGTVEIGWHAATLAPLFPVFAGRLTIREGELALDGYYAPPGGRLGRVADRLLLHTAARGTARWLLKTIIERARR
jgi:hypothetical protein